MSYLQPIRARYELAIRDALGNLEPSVQLYYDNVGEEPPRDGGALVEYGVITVSFPNGTEPLICREASSIRAVRGNVQVNLYHPRQLGMLRLEEMADAVICALMRINTYPFPEGVITHTGSVTGPNPLLIGDDPLAQTVVSAPFTARLGDGAWVDPNWNASGGGSGSIDGGTGGDINLGGGIVRTADVALTHPTRVGEAGLHGDVIPDPPPGAMTQEDANEYIMESLDAIDEYLSPLDGGDY